MEFKCKCSECKVDINKKDKCLRWESEKMLLTALKKCQNEHQKLIDKVRELNKSIYN